MHKAINAKFKKGDRVVWVSQGKRGVVTNPYAKGEYAVRFEGDRNDTWIAEEKLRAANCATTNAVVAKAVANARAANSTDAAEATVAKNALTAKQYKEITELLDSVDGDITDSEDLVGDLYRNLDSALRDSLSLYSDFDEEVKREASAINGLITQCDTHRRALKTALDKIDSLVSKMYTKYSHPDPKRLIDG